MRGRLYDRLPDAHACRGCYGCGLGVLLSELATEWEEVQMAVLNVSHENFDGVNLVQLATGKTNQVHLSAVSPIQAAFLAAFVSLHAPGPVAVVLPPPSVRIVLAGRANALGESGGATHGALLGEGAGDVGGEVLDDNMMGLRGMIDPQVIKVFDKKGHHPGKFSVKYKHRVMEKTSTGF